jgi:hypothetical protein
MPEPDVVFRLLNGDQAAAHLDELRALYREVYAHPPYEWGDEHAALFAERFEVQRGQPGFALAEARAVRPDIQALATAHAPRRVRRGRRQRPLS